MFTDEDLSELEMKHIWDKTVHRLGPGMLVGFAVYVIVVEEFHWRIHLGDRFRRKFN